MTDVTLSQMRTPVAEYWDPKGKSDMERGYRREWEANFHDLIPGEWKDGQFISGHFPDRGMYGGYTVEPWQLDQHMHFIRKERGEVCFAGCKQCEKSRENETAESETVRYYGKPWPQEKEGHFACPDPTCLSVFNFKSQLLKHFEADHHRRIPWYRYCDICGWEAKAEQEQIARMNIAKHRKDNHPHAEMKEIEKDLGADTE